MRLLVFVFALAAGMLNLSSASSLYYHRVAVKQEADVYRLWQQGYQLADARISHLPFKNSSRVQIQWLPENGYVTVVSNQPLTGKLEQAGFQVIKSGVHRRQSVTSPRKEIPYQFGWPKTMQGWPTIYGQATTVDDVNGDDYNELFLSNIEGWIYLWRFNGTFVPGYPLQPYTIPLIDPQTGDTSWVSWASTGSRECAACGDINGDGQKEFIFGKDIGKLFAYQYNTQQVAGFPRDLGLAYFSNDPALFDFDNDGRDEIVLMTYLWPSVSAYGPAQVHIFNEDGTELPGWPQSIPVNSLSSPAVGDIDGDGEPEIVVGSGEDPDNNIPGRLYAFNLDGSICQGFPIEVGYSVNCTPSLADINLDNVVDILIRVKMKNTGINGIYAFDGSGNLLPGFPAEMDFGHYVGAPAVADVNGDGLPEIAYGTAHAVDSGMVWLFSNTGQLMPGFPRLVYATWVEESVTLEDVSGDGLADIVAGTNGLSNDPARLWAFDYQGQVVSGFPITINELFSTLESTPTLVDIDKDGDIEIFTASHGGTVYGFDTPGVPANSSWPVYKYNNQRTGNNQIVTVGIPAEPENLPEGVALLPNYPNPFNGETMIRFKIPGAARVTVEVFNGSGQRVTVLADHQPFQAGLHQIRFQAENLASGVYFYRCTVDRIHLVGKMLLMK